MKPKTLIIVLVAVLIMLVSCGSSQRDAPEGGYCEKFTYDGWTGKIMDRCVDLDYGHVCYIPNSGDQIVCFEIED